MVDGFLWFSRVLRDILWFFGFGMVLSWWFIGVWWVFFFRALGLVICVSDVCVSALFVVGCCFLIQFVVF